MTETCKQSDRNYHYTNFGQTLFDFRTNTLDGNSLMGYIKNGLGHALYFVIELTHVNQKTFIMHCYYVTDIVYLIHELCNYYAKSKKCCCAFFFFFFQYIFPFDPILKLIELLHICKFKFIPLWLYSQFAY